MVIFKKKTQIACSLLNFSLAKNNVLIKRKTGGFGDILMHRMLFEDLKEQFPELDFTFACPRPFIRMMENHPFVKALPLDLLDESKYAVIYDTTTACRVHELKHLSDNNKHRSDIWAEYLGIKLTKHNMHLKVKEDAKIRCNEFKSKNDNKIVFLSMHSVPNDYGDHKKIEDQTLQDFVMYLHSQNFILVSAHHEIVDIYKNLPVIQYTALDYDYWIALVDMADYIITIDSATLHIAGGLNKKTLGIFAVTKGNVYAKYYENTLILQGHCPFGKSGCFNYLYCPEKELPCQKNITLDILINNFNKLLLQ